jgi:hypothetical protein
VLTREGTAVVDGVDPQKKSIWIRYLDGGQKRRLTLEQFTAIAAKK